MQQQPVSIVRMLATATRPCKRCNTKIYFVAVGTKMHPFDPSGDSHFATCPYGAQYRLDAAAKLAAQNPTLFGPQDLQEPREYPD